jgi:metal-sulfur cluster biosynthetic enzyme
MLIREIIMGTIAAVEDPEIGVGVVDLGLIYEIAITNGSEVKILMTLTTPYCPYGPALVGAVEQAVKALDGVTKVDVQLTWEPPWDPEIMASDYAKDVLGIW